MMQKAELLRWLAVNGGFLGSLIAGIFWQAAWAENIAVFYIVTISVLSGLALFNLETLAKSFNPGVPHWIDVIVDILCILIMAGAGWFLCAGLYLFHMVVTSSLWIRALKQPADGSEEQCPEE